MTRALRARRVTAGLALTLLTTVLATAHPASATDGLPEPPPVTSTQPDDGGLLVSFGVSPDDGGSPITSYSASCESTDGGATAIRSRASSPIRVPDLTPGKTYQCQVRATNATGDGPYGSWGYPVTMAKPGEAPGPRVTSTTAGPGTATVRFIGQGDGGSPIRWYDAQCESLGAHSAPGGPGFSSPIKLDGLRAGYAYHCHVRAVNTSRVGPWGGWGEVIVVPPATVPRPPIVKRTTVRGPGLLSVAGDITTDGGSPVTSFLTQCRSTDGGRTVSGGSGAVIGFGLTGGKSYHCRLRALNAVGASGYSDDGATVLVPPPTVPSRITRVTATVAPEPGALVVVARYEDAIQTDGGSPIKRYKASCVSQDGGPTVNQVGESTTITVTGLAAGAYRCRLITKNAMGWSAGDLSQAVTVS